MGESTTFVAERDLRHTDCELVTENMPKFVNRPDLHLTKASVSIFPVRPIYGPHYGSQKIEIETAMFAAKIDRIRSFLQKSTSTQHYVCATLTNVHLKCSVHSCLVALWLCRLTWCAENQIVMSSILPVSWPIVYCLLTEYVP